MSRNGVSWTDLVESRHAEQGLLPLENEGPIDFSDIDDGMDQFA